MELLQSPPMLQPTLIVITWTAVVGLLALAFVALLRWAQRHEAAELAELEEMLESANQALAGFEARERAHLQEIARLQRRLAEIGAMERAA